MPLLKVFILLLFVCACNPGHKINFPPPSDTTQDQEDEDTNHQEVEPPTLSTPFIYNIGIIGESHTNGAFGKTLAEDLTTKGDVTHFAVGGSSTQFWLRSSEFQFKWGYILDRYLHQNSTPFDIDKGTRIFLSKEITRNFLETNQFDVVVIQLMDNQLGRSVQNNIASVREFIELIYETSPSPHCFYVSATHKDRPGSYPSVTNTKKRNFIDQVLIPALQDTNCQLIDSMRLFLLSKSTLPMVFI